MTSLIQLHISCVQWCVSASRVPNSKIKPIETRELNYGFVIICHFIRSGGKEIRKPELRSLRHSTSSSITGIGTAPSPTGRSQAGPCVGEDRGTQRIESCKQFAALETSDSINEGWLNLVIRVFVLLWQQRSRWCPLKLVELCSCQTCRPQGNAVESCHDLGLERGSLIKWKGIC